MTVDDTLAWLLEPDEPSVRYPTLKELLGRPDEDGEVAKAKRAIMERGPAAAILARQNEDGGFMTPEMVKRYGIAVAKSGYQPKKNSIWQLLILAQLGVDPHDPRVRKLCEYVLANNYNSSKGVMGVQVQTLQGIDFFTWPCFIANMVWSLSLLGYSHDPRVRDTLKWLLKYQRFDDGDFKTPDEWPYRGGRDRCFGRHTCYRGVTRVLNMLTAVPGDERTREMNDFIARAADFVLRHRLYRRNHSEWQPIRREFELFTFPILYNDDVISIVDALQRLGVKHEAVDEGIGFIMGKRGPDGRWKLDYTMNRSSTYANFGQRGEPSKWITLRALKVLKNAGMVEAFY